MDDQLNNGFCPECGALLRDGVCPSCGYGDASAETGSQQDDSYGDGVTSDGSGSQQNGGYGTGQNTGTRNYERYQAAMNQNLYYQNPQSQTDPNAGSGQNMQTKKSKKGVVIAVIIAVLLCIALLVSSIVYIFVMAKREMAQDEAYTYEDTDSSDVTFADDEADDVTDSDDADEWDSDDWNDGGTDSYDDEMLAFTDDIDWDDTSWSEEPENYTADELYDDYYECYVGYNNCIDETVSYDVVHESWEETDEDQNVCIRVNYYQLEGNIPNLDDINEELRYQASWPGDLYFEMPDEFEEIFDEYGPGYVVSVDSYVTYNDEEKISVVSDIYYESASSIGQMLYGVNVDLTSGEIMVNSRMLDVTDEFLEEYKEICEYQNGTVEIFDELTNDELRDFFEDKDDLILYYTPFGLEVGINYETDERYGWVSATLTDYEQYLK